MSDGKGGNLGVRKLICSQQNFDNCFTLQRKGIDLESKRVKQLRSAACLKFKEAVDVSIEKLNEEANDKREIVQDLDM
jgi:hypothetical protein